MVEDSSAGDLGGDDKKGFGGICNASRFPSNISITLLMDGLSDGFVCMHHKPIMIIFLTIRDILAH